VYVGILFLFDEDLIEKTKTEPWYVKASSLNKFGIGFLISRWMLWLKDFIVVYVHASLQFSQTM
jgi:hypothetical protein